MQSHPPNVNESLIFSNLTTTVDHLISLPRADLDPGFDWCRKLYDMVTTIVSIAKRKKANESQQGSAEKAEHGAWMPLVFKALGLLSEVSRTVNGVTYWLELSIGHPRFSGSSLIKHGSC
jgi:hypothetical protein